MGRLTLVTIPDPRLRVVTKLIENFDDPRLQSTIDDMVETMYAENGVGLAATQVGLDIRLTVIDCSKNRDQPQVLINPELLEAKNFVSMEEACLSVPGHYDTVTRATWVKVKAYDRYGKPFEFEAEDLLAECCQHEIDHLHGKLYIDQLSAFKRKRVEEKVIKFLRKRDKQKNN